MVKCPECVAAGEKSIVYASPGWTTLMYFQPFYDEEGVFHHHDGNTTTTNYSCSKGHAWTEKSTGSCHCGWPNKKED